MCQKQVNSIDILTKRNMKRLGCMFVELLYTITVLSFYIVTQRLGLNLSYLLAVVALHNAVLKKVIFHGTI